MDQQRDGSLNILAQIPRASLRDRAVQHHQPADPLDLESRPEILSHPFGQGNSSNAMVELRRSRNGRSDPPLSLREDQDGVGLQAPGRGQRTYQKGLVL